MSNARKFEYRWSATIHFEGVVESNQPHVLRDQIGNIKKRLRTMGDTTVTNFMIGKHYPELDKTELDLCFPPRKDDEIL